MARLGLVEDNLIGRLVGLLGEREGITGHGFAHGCCRDNPAANLPLSQSNRGGKKKKTIFSETIVLFW